MVQCTFCSFQSVGNYSPLCYTKIFPSSLNTVSKLSLVTSRFACRQRGWYLVLSFPVLHMSFYHRFPTTYLETFPAWPVCLWTPLGSKVFHLVIPPTSGKSFCFPPSQLISKHSPQLVVFLPSCCAGHVSSYHHVPAEVPHMGQLPSKTGSWAKFSAGRTVK